MKASKTRGHRSKKRVAHSIDAPDRRQVDYKPFCTINIKKGWLEPTLPRKPENLA